MGRAARFGTWAGPLYCSAVPSWPGYYSGPGWHDTGERAVSCLRKWPIVPPCRPIVLFAHCLLFPQVLFHQFTSAQIQEFKLLTLQVCINYKFFGIISTSSNHHKVEVFIFSYFF